MEKTERSEDDSVVDSELESMSSTVSSIFGSDDARSSSSGNISTASSSSGDILAAMVPRLLMEPPAASSKCVRRSNKGVAWGHTSVIGRRKEMEDAVAVVPGFMTRSCDRVGGCAAPGSRSSCEISPVHFFGVYDGHGGSQPDREDEQLRIEGQDGKVINWKGARVFGVLAMSRAIGDHYMRPWIIPVPEITFTTRTDEDECLILASDGLWDVMSSSEVGAVARRLLRRQRRCMIDDEVTPAQAVANSLTEIALGRNSSDNISIIVVDLKPKRKRLQRQ